MTRVLTPTEKFLETIAHKPDVVLNQSETGSYIFDTLKGLGEFDARNAFHSIHAETIVASNKRTIEIGFIRSDGETRYKTFSLSSQTGGKRRTNTKKSLPKWKSTSRKVVTRTGAKKTLYRNAATGDVRVKKFVERNGVRVATYVNPARS